MTIAVEQRGPTLFNSPIRDIRRVLRVKSCRIFGRRPQPRPDLLGDVEAACRIRCPNHLCHPHMNTFGRIVANPSGVWVQGAGSIPILSFTADEIRWVATEVSVVGQFDLLQP